MAEAWEYAGEEWKGGKCETDTPEFRRWFRARVAALMAAHFVPEGIPLVVRFAEASLADYCIWVAADTYRGEGYCNGAWHVYHTTIVDDYVRARASSCLDYWLAEDFHNLLPAVCVPTEPSAYHVLNAAGLSDRRYWAQLQHIRAHWPTNCRKCGESFRTTRQGQEVCRPCRGLPQRAAPESRVYRSKVCPQCEGEFTPTSGRQVTCVTCKGSKPRGRPA